MKQISRAAVIWQLVAFASVLLPHLSWLPAWLIGVCILTPAARLMIHTGRWPLPHWSIKLLLILTVAAGLVLTFTRATGMSGTVALLIAGLALKLLEIYHRRDALVLLYVALFVLATSFLFSQGIGVGVYALFSTLIIITALNSIHQDPLRTDLFRPLRRASRLVLYALPLMLVLFVLFPRIGPLWSMPLDQQVARSGLSDSMTPGDISQLMRSGQVAFRASFNGAPPAPGDRYWRSMVYSEFDGLTWRRASGARDWSLRQEALEAGHTPISYEVIFEPSNQRWLVALDQPAGAPERTFLSQGRTLVAVRPADRRFNYRVTSYLGYRLQPRLGIESQRHYLQLPGTGNPASRDQAALWWQHSGGDPRIFVDRILQLFNQSFVYTLTPPRLSGDTIDQFLFESRAGFCGHYAGALTFLLRSVGVPARVVAGYQGGEWNPYEQYMTLRQYDAHAWAEYWIDGEGWIRVDPTAAVAPERVNASAAQAYADDPEFLADAPLSALRFGRSGWLLDLRQQIDAVNYVWHRWVLNYQGQQMALLTDWFGQVTALKMVLALLLPFALVIGLVAWQQLHGRRRQRVRDPLERPLRRLLLRLARRGWARDPQESLQAYARRMVTLEPRLAEPLRILAQADEAVRYGQQPEQQEQLARAIRHCQRALRRL